jgi:metallo-beta-lactamase family protein
MKLTFWGAARQVTGSMHMLRLDSGYTILIDCGLDYENKDDFDANNRNFPFLPEEVDLVILTHAHIDHSGNLPNFVRQGYTGQILCSSATVELTKNLLLDSLNVQQIEQHKKKGAQHKNKKKGKRLKRSEQMATLYNKQHIGLTYDAMVGIDFYKKFKINDEVTVEFYEAGHILGAASVKLTIQENGIEKNIGFTGDLGNYGAKLVKDPQPMSGLDYLVSESTYGSRMHQDSGEAEKVMLEYIQNTCVKYNGKLVIPAFSVGRTQSIIFTLNQLFRKGLLPEIKIFTDSPLAIKTTRMYAEHINLLNDEAVDFYKQYGSLFSFDNLYSIEGNTDSKMISSLPEPIIIISAAGMVEGGRIQEHVRNNIGDAYSTILIAGYCAEGTLGYELLKGRSVVKINKKERQVYAKIAKTDAFSAHPDQDGLIKYFQDSGFDKLKKLFFVHGDYSGMQILKDKLNSDKVIIPEMEESFDL